MDEPTELKKSLLHITIWLVVILSSTIIVFYFSLSIGWIFITAYYSLCYYIAIIILSKHNSSNYIGKKYYNNSLKKDKKYKLKKMRNGYDKFLSAVMVACFLALLIPLIENIFQFNLHNILAICIPITLIVFVIVILIINANEYALFNDMFFTNVFSTINYHKLKSVRLEYKDISSINKRKNRLMIIINNETIIYRFNSIDDCIRVKRLIRKKLRILIK